MNSYLFSAPSNSAVTTIINLCSLVDKAISEAAVISSSPFKSTLFNGSVFSSDILYNLYVPPFAGFGIILYKVSSESIDALSVILLSSSVITVSPVVVPLIVTFY